MKSILKAPLNLSLALFSVAAFAPGAQAATTPVKASYVCESETTNAGYAKVFNELTSLNQNPDGLEAGLSSLILATDIILPRAFPSKLQISFDRDEKKVSATFSQLSSQLNDGDRDLLAELLFRPASNNPLDESLWIDDFKPEILALPEGRIFRDKVLQASAGHGRLTSADFEKFSDAAVRYVQKHGRAPLSRLQFIESTQKWAWGEAALDQREETILQRKEQGAFILLRAGNYGLIKVQGAKDSLLSGHPASCKPDGE